MVGKRRGRGLGRWLALAVGVWFLVGSPLPSAEAGPVPAVDIATQESTAEGHEAQDLPEEVGHAEEGDHAEGEGHARIRDIFFVLITILVMGKLFGEMAERRGQPAVLGELVAGVILGASVLGVIPAAGPIYEIVHVFAEVGVAILLFEIGLETDLKEMFRVGPTAMGVALIGVFVPFGLGFLYWYFVNPSIGVHPEGISFAIVAVFVGATLTATSVGITARVLSDLDRMHTPEARIIIGAAVIDDVLGIVILAVVSGLAGGAAVTLGYVSKTFLFAVGFLVLAVVVGNRFAPSLFNLVDRMRVRGSLLVAAFCFALGIAALADLAIFFVAVGAPVNVQLFIPGSEDFNGTVLVVGLILTVVAIIGKLVSGLAVRRPDIDKLLVGVGMVPRGEVGLIFASIGLTAGILSGSVYSAILIMVILSTFIVPPILKLLFARKPAPEPDLGMMTGEPLP